ncbi:SDR family NAD(P)-dependent oxidoreductase [Deinococcus psychrotolerans]|uniref:SDR family NAD(P)-dependent oxidoreductase n=1 Tax=Deinococcus psychrotolerans TaxID=2489213 RepID=A0A3G8YG37_9DEIO|nr:SDR family NAD(P)-dependent oxidoreductase [Deinococcus psychrotolerans]AZI41504.1 SDR family NAD(P)-dependent oxidoreductase [Deinococcus psychrotolerans]
MEPSRLRGQIIAVTSGDQGYGRSISAALARAGASVVLIGINPETLSAHASSIEQLGGTAIPLKADVSVPLDWASAQARMLEIFGALHGIVHLADKRSHSNFTLLSESEWMELFNCNIKSSVSMTQNIQRRLPGTWLTIVGPHLDEIGLQAFPQRGALRGLVERAASDELRLNMVLPGRASSEEKYDAPLCEVVLTLALPEMQHLRGNVLEVPLPAVPKYRDQEREVLVRNS